MHVQLQFARESWMAPPRSPTLRSPLSPVSVTPIGRCRGPARAAP